MSEIKARIRLSLLEALTDNLLRASFLAPGGGCQSSARLGL